MVTANELVNRARAVADAGKGFDADGYYGMQCVDLDNGLLKEFYGKMLSGNAIDLLNSAAHAGYEVVYDAPNVNPRKGAFFVMKTYAHKYGHTGLVIEDSDGQTLKTIEQNVDGNADALYRGAPARYRIRPFKNHEGQIIGWFYPPYQENKKEVKEPKGAKPMYKFYHVLNDSNFPSGAIFIANFYTNTIYPANDPDELVYLNEVVKQTTGFDVPMTEYETGAPILRVMGATGMKLISRNW